MWHFIYLFILIKQAILSWMEAEMASRQKHMREIKSRRKLCPKCYHSSLFISTPSPFISVLTQRESENERTNRLGLIPGQWTQKLEVPGKVWHHSEASDWLLLEGNPCYNWVEPDCRDLLFSFRFSFFFRISIFHFLVPF